MLAFASLDYVDCRDDTVLWVDFGRVFVPAPGHGTGFRIKKLVGIRIAETDRTLAAIQEGRQKGRNQIFCHTLRLTGLHTK